MYANLLISAEKPPRVFHIYRRGPRHQLSFDDFFLPVGGKLSGDNRWIKLAELLPWDELEDDYASQIYKGFGAQGLLEVTPRVVPLLAPATPAA